MQFQENVSCNSRNFGIQIGQVFFFKKLGPKKTRRTIGVRSTMVGAIPISLHFELQKLELHILLFFQLLINFGRKKKTQRTTTSTITTLRTFTIWRTFLFVENDCDAVPGSSTQENDDDFSRNQLLNTFEIPPSHTSIEQQYPFLSFPGSIPHVQMQQASAYCYSQNEQITNSIELNNAMAPPFRDQTFHQDWFQVAPRFP